MVTSKSKGFLTASVLSFGGLLTAVRYVLGLVEESLCNSYALLGEVALFYRTYVCAMACCFIGAFVLSAFFYGYLFVLGVYMNALMAFCM